MLKIPVIDRWKWFLIVGTVVVLPILFLVCQAWFNPEIEFLVPSLSGRWILHSPDMPFPEKLSGTILFRRAFDLSTVPAQCILRVRAASRFRMAVNGRIVERDSQSTHWKTARSYDVATFLVPSRNRIEILVTNRAGLPALLVEASPIAGSSLNLRSDAAWESAAGPDSPWRPCRYPYHEPPVFGEDKSAVQKTPLLPFYVILSIIYVGFILAAVSPWRIFGVRAVSEETASSPSWVPVLTATMVALGIAAILIINFHNLLSYPYSRSLFDFEAHIAYVKYVAEYWRVPVATEGWQMYQPPLYYWFSAVVYSLAGGAGNEPASLQAVQAIGTLSGLACIVLSGLVLRVCAKNNVPAQVIGAATVAFLPMVFYVSPTISNETFSAAVICLALYLLVRHCFGESLAIGRAALLGGVFGLALLSKYTALALCAVAVGVFLARIWIRAGHRIRESVLLIVFCASAVAVSGWFYERNVRVFHKPLIANWDAEAGFNLEQPPGYRTPGFYLTFGSVFAHAPERSRWSSFWDSYYGSMWMDTHFNMTGFTDRKASAYGSVLLILALLPSAAICLGLVRSLKRLVGDRLFEADSALITFAFVMTLGLIWHSLRTPSITVIKAIFSLSLLPAFAVFSGFGFTAMAKNLGRFSAALYVSLAVLFSFIGYLFWYRP
jgi:hypothetical protein